MGTYNKRKGSKFEVDVMSFLRSLGHFAERLAKAGSNDEGDIVTIIAGQTYILECKNRKTLSLPQFWEEAQTEAANYAKARGLPSSPVAFVVVKRRNASIADAWVIQTLSEWVNNLEEEIDNANTRRRDNDNGDLEQPRPKQAERENRKARRKTKG